MKNKIAGFLVIGIAILMGFVIYSYQSTLSQLATETCPITGDAFCIHEELANQQININVAILVLVIAIGFYLIFFSKEERIITKLLRVKEQVSKKISKDNYRKVLSSLESDEKDVLEHVLSSNGSIYQSALVEKTGFSKVHVTRILDKLEGKQLIERKRRGMTNIVLLRN
ncbi:MAG TPA: MarR family transcriptional regulator [Candidatus Nanoarchaeia archaeon]|nr:MarR family transcriptional regulator [Candidatus Nanoarchaeia archaeon]